jgi:uncharacterized membrane protein
LRTGVLEPIKAIIRERGSLYMVVIALIYSVTSVLGKIAIAHSSAAFFGATYYGALALVLFPIITYQRGRRTILRSLRENARIALVPGVFDAAAAITHFYAMSMANVAYMIAIKRSSLLIGSLYGFLLFGERNVRERMVGAALMFTGFVLVVVSV